MTVEERLGPFYVLREEIARDGWSTVRRATSRNGGPDVAALIVRPEFAADRGLRDILAREEAALRELHHESLVEVRDLVTDDGLLALILDPAEGPALSEENGWGSLADAALLAARVGDALAVAHAHGVVHLRLEPGNVYRTQSSVKISGCGVPALLREAGVPVPDSAYAAPELSGPAMPTAAADVYSLGVMTVEAFTGVRPPGADLESLPPQLQALLRKLLSTNPRERPSARSAAAQFRAIADELTSDAGSAPPAPEPELSDAIPATPAPAPAAGSDSAADPVQIPAAAEPDSAAVSFAVPAVAGGSDSAGGSVSVPAAASGSFVEDRNSPAPGPAPASDAGVVPGRDAFAASDSGAADGPGPVPPAGPAATAAASPSPQPVADMWTSHVSAADTPPDDPDHGWVEESPAVREPAALGAGPVLSIGQKPRARVIRNRRRTLVSSAVLVVLAAVALIAVESRADDEPGAAPPAVLVPRTDSAAPEATPTTATATTEPAPASLATETLAWPKRSTYAAHLPGKAGTLYVAIRDGRGIAYMCDGKRLEAWFKGPATDGSVTLSGKAGATLTGRYSGSEIAGQVKVQGKTYKYDVPTVHKPSGLYRAAAKVRNADVKGGWIVLSDGSQVGVLTIGEIPQPAPTLNTAIRSASIDGTSLLATEIDVETGGGFG
uniref:serine/threonine protein kinase n=1 Tax=Paractinoplanes polyasparticus TaxID=2856853 RepID=UPI001C84A3C8|nr:protein kinase [Actinoplanes polyasparticus]